MTSEQIAQVESVLQYTFSDKQLLVTAFTHSSYANATSAQDNERLEFLGDAILDMVVSQYLCDKFSARSVGALSTMRANIVSAEGLRPIVNQLGIIKFLQVGYGAANIKNSSKKLEANLYEAIVAAIYLDSGFDNVKRFVLRTLEPSLNAVGISEQKDSKTLLQEYCLKHKKSLPKYVETERLGSDNAPIYKYDLYIDGVYMCSGQGSSKKSAEQDAAKKLVTKWRID